MAALEGLGRPIIAAQSGEEALACLEREAIALILLDVQMPGLDGFQTLMKVREQKRWADIPVVFMSPIHHDPEQVARGFAMGAVDYIAQPFNADFLIPKLRALVSWQHQSEQLRAEAEELAREKATRAERERVLGIVSHDLRSPLATIRTGADYLLASGLTPPQRTVAHRIQRNADRMARLIDDLLDFTRLLRGALSIRPKVSCFANLIVEVIDDLRQVSARPIELAVQTQASGPVDSDRLAQAVANLVLNAIQHSQANARVSVVLRESSDGFELSVWNEGEMKATDQEAIFKPFHRGDGSSGLGLGLFISREIARAHGGDLTVSSSRGAGTTFCLSIPNPGRAGA